MRKTVVGLIAAVFVLALGTSDVSAAQLTKNTVVYITKTGSTYHLKSDCSSCDSKRTYAKTLYDILNSGNYKMCKTCAKEYGVNINDSQNLTLDMLPYELGSNVSVTETETEESLNSDESKDSSTGSGSNTSDNKSGNSNNSGSNSSDDSITSKSNDNSNKDSNNNSNNSEVTSSGSGNDSKNSNKTQDSKNTQTTKKTTTNKSNSSNSSGVKELMTQKQRRNKFLSKSNPKRGTKPKTTERPDDDGYQYADFAKFNSYNSDNGLGGTPIYLSGRIKDIQPAKQYGSEYSLAIMVDDTDGYQWYMRCKCTKSNYDKFKEDLLGKDAAIYGTYAGYSGVTNRPMMDILRVVDNNGNDIDVSVYKQ